MGGRNLRPSETKEHRKPFRLNFGFLLFYAEPRGICRRVSRQDIRDRHCADSITTRCPCCDYLLRRSRLGAGKRLEPNMSDLCILDR
jgi:hypothetical protein